MLSKGLRFHNPPISMDCTNIHRGQNSFGYPWESPWWAGQQCSPGLQGNVKITGQQYQAVAATTLSATSVQWLHGRRNPGEPHSKP